MRLNSSKIKLAIALLACLLVNFAAFSQGIKRHVLGSLGAFHEGTNIMINTTFAQPPNAGTINNASNYLRQGFQQPICLYAPQAAIAANTDTQCLSGNIFNFSYPLSADSFTAFQWNFGPSASITSSTSRNPSGITFSSPGVKYIGLIVKRGACRDSTTIQVVVMSAPAISLPIITVHNDTLCNGSSAVITATDTTGTIVHFNFYDSLFNGNFIGISPLTVSPTSTTTYYLEITNQYGCARAGGRVPVTVYVVSAPTIQGITVSNDTVCYGYNTILIANTSPTGAIVTWWDTLLAGNLLSTGDTFLTGNLTHTITYYAQATSANGCATALTRTPATIYVAPQNAITLTSDKPNNTVLLGETITFTANPNGFSNYQFFVNNVSVQSGNSNVFSSNALTNNDTVAVIATDNGCASLKAEVVVISGNFPNAFTPNGDGKNDVYLKDYDLTILNRWGQELYSGLNGWDGTYKGQKVSPGTYFYIVKLNSKTLKGTVTVVEQ